MVVAKSAPGWHHRTGMAASAIKRTPVYAPAYRRRSVTSQPILFVSRYAEPAREVGCTHIQVLDPVVWVALRRLSRTYF